MELFTLKTISRLTGLSADTVRAWEKRYQAVTPLRSDNGRRAYSQSEVNRLKLLAELTNNGHSIGRIANLPDSKLVSLLATHHESGTPAKKQALNPQVEKLSDQLLDSVERFDLRSLEVQLTKASFSLSPRELLFYFIPQLMVRVGELINTNEISIAQEHALSELIKKYIRRTYDILEPLENTLPKAPTILFATPENHLHEFGVMMAAILCRHHGFKTHYLGPNIPAKSLINAVNTLKPYALAIGFSNNQAISFLKELDQGLKPNTMLWLGGKVPKFKNNSFRSSIWKFETLEELEEKIKTIHRS